MNLNFFKEVSDVELIKLDEYFDIYKYKEDGKNKVFKYNVNLDHLLLKDNNDLSNLEYMFREVLIGYISKYANINSLCPRFININNKYGITEDSFIEKGYYPLSGFQLLEYYYDYLKENGLLPLSEYDKSEYITYNMNNLSTIYDALNYYFMDEEIANKLFEQIITLFAFDFVTLQNDRTPGNWSILLSDNYSPKLSKLYDNEESFISNYDMKMGVMNNNETKREMIENLARNFDQKYFDLFAKIVEKTNICVIFDALLRMELETHCKDNKTKEQIIDMFIENYTNLCAYIKDAKNIKHKSLKLC